MSFLKALYSRHLTVEIQSSWFCFMPCSGHSGELLLSNKHLHIFFFASQAAGSLIPELPRRNPNHLFQISYAVCYAHLPFFFYSKLWHFLPFLPTFLFMFSVFLQFNPYHVRAGNSPCCAPGNLYIQSGIREAVGVVMLCKHFLLSVSSWEIIMFKQVLLNCISGIYCAVQCLNTSA